MKRIFLAATVAASLAIAGCNGSATWGKISAGVGAVIGTTNNVLADLAQNSIPAACGIIATAEGYFHQLEPRISADKIAIERKAEAAVAVICNDPPSNVSKAMAALVKLWFTIQDATKTSA